MQVKISKNMNVRKKKQVFLKIILFTVVNDENEII